MLACLEDPAVATELEKVNLIPIPRKSLPKNELIIGSSHSSPIPVRSCLKSCMLGFMHYANQEFPDVQAGFRKGRGTRDQIANIFWIIQKAREFQKKKTSTIAVSLTTLKR